MSFSITVNVDDLYKMAKKLKDDNMDTVNIMLLEDELEDGVEYEEDDLLPPALAFTAYTKDSPEIGIDYEEIESVWS